MKKQFRKDGKLNDESQHGGKLPETSEEKAEFKEKLKAEKIKGDEENYEEALAQAYRVWIKSEVRDVWGKL